MVLRCYNYLVFTNYIDILLVSDGDKSSLQQWLEYCSKGKKQCPICKQKCAASNVSRLYFQSAGDSNDSNPSQKPQTHKEGSRELKLEVRRLERKVNALNSALESREDDITNVSNELCVCKEQLKKEASLKNETLEQTLTIHRKLNLKTQVSCYYKIILM
ncbi:hypothetical protein Hdeb2414_s0032g00715951 [Helianthus debilis subsp. tardiflorus]